MRKIGIGHGRGVLCLLKKKTGEFVHVISEIHPSSVLRLEHGRTGRRRSCGSSRSRSQEGGRRGERVDHSGCWLARGAAQPKEVLLARESLLVLLLRHQIAERVEHLRRRCMAAVARCRQRHDPSTSATVGQNWQRSKCSGSWPSPLAKISRGRGG